MLEIILIASGAFLAALFCVWVYRLAKSMHEAKFRQVKLSGQKRNVGASRESGSVHLSNSGAVSGGSRKPWGW